MSFNVNNTRFVLLRSDVAGIVPTIPTANNHLEFGWLSTDLYDGQMFVNTADKKVWVRTDTTITELDTASMYLYDLLDVAIIGSPGPTDGQVLAYDSASGHWINQDPTVTATNLDDLADVDAAAPSDGDVLTYDSASGDWMNRPSVAVSGYSGYSGYSGQDGMIGVQGVSGYSGYSGISGISGYSGAPAYNVYTALLTQSGTAAPTATVLENTTGATLTYTRSGDGEYEIHSDLPIFVQNKTWYSLDQVRNKDKYLYTFSMVWKSLTEMELRRVDEEKEAYYDLRNTYVPIEIRIYH